MPIVSDHRKEACSRAVPPGCPVKAVPIFIQNAPSPSSGDEGSKVLHFFQRSPDKIEGNRQFEEFGFRNYFISGGFHACMSDV